MKLSCIVLAAVLATCGLGQQTLATPALPITDGLVCQLDATDAANIHYDTSNNITGWYSSQGSAGFYVAPVGGRTGAVYSSSGGGNNNLPRVVFSGTSVLDQAGGGQNTVKSVFIMENTTATALYGGIFGRYNRDRGIRFNVDNGASGSIFGGPAVVGTNLYDNLGPVVVGGTHQLINGVSSTVDAINYGSPGFSLNPYTPYRKDANNLGALNDFGINDQGVGQGGSYTENYYWSDTTIADGRQTWQNKNWGTLGAYAYDNYPSLYEASGDRAIALGAYFSGHSGWEGSIGEVLVYNRYLTDAERQSVEAYLAAKWLVASSWGNYLPGDFNKDGQVGPEDFGILKDNFGSSNLAYGSHDSWTLGDANDDGQVGPEDFGLLKDNFGASNGPHTPLANVPEPATLALLALGGILAARKNRR